MICRSGLVLLTLIFSVSAFAMEDLTKGKSFFPWLWEDQLHPTIQKAGSGGNLTLLGGGVVLAAAAQSQDKWLTDRSQSIMTSSQAKIGSVMGSGAPGIAIALAQLYFDPSNGLAHSRALILTAATHITTAVAVSRKRPNGNNLSFPSGHSSSSFATATSLAYAYGPWVGVPALMGASFVAASRIYDRAHWFSDVVGGAALGIYWAKASTEAGREGATSAFIPVPFEDGLMVSWEKRF